MGRSDLTRVTLNQRTDYFVFGNGDENNQSKIGVLVTVMLEHIKV